MHICHVISENLESSAHTHFSCRIASESFRYQHHFGKFDRSWRSVVLWFTRRSLEKLLESTFTSIITFLSYYKSLPVHKHMNSVLTIKWSFFYYLLIVFSLSSLSPQQELWVSFRLEAHNTFFGVWYLKKVKIPCLFFVIWFFVSMCTRRFV